MKDFNIKDFIYLRYVEDTKEFDCKKGDIVRYQKDWLLDELKGRRFNTCFENNNLIWTENPNADENDVMFNKVYDSIIVSEDMRGEVYLWEDDYLFLDDWLLSHLDSSGIDLIMNLQKKELPSQNNKNKLVQLKEGCPDVNARMFMHFKKGEKLDFSVPGVAAIFYDLNWLKIFAKTEVIIGEEKEKLFKEDFSNAIKAVKIEDIVYSHPTEEEQHFFKIKENIKTKIEIEYIVDGEKYKILYGHLYPKSATVKVGDKVKSWQKIAEVGTTGYSTGNHLHWKVTKDGKEIDGMNLVDFNNLINKSN